jgi:4-hydroxyproline epimerase
MQLQVIDSHTEGEPTRVIVSPPEELMAGTMTERVERFRRDYDWLRSSVCNEPRGHDAMVGALLCPSELESCACGVIFFNNVDTLGMCIHGTIGLVATLVHLGRMGPGTHGIETPVGVVRAEVGTDGTVAVTNVPSYRTQAAVSVEVPDWGRVTGDVAWGGNWFFLINGQGPEVKPGNLDALTRFSRAVRVALRKAGVVGTDGGEVDHIEVFGPPTDPTTSDSRNFVLCPGSAYDRSPCGTGTSAKLACLHADGKLSPGQVWRQAGILDTVFEGSVEPIGDGKVLPRVSGRAWVIGEATCFFNEDDPFRYGIPSI